MKFNLSRRIALNVGILVLVVCIGLGLTSYILTSNSAISEAENITAISKRRSKLY